MRGMNTTSYERISTYFELQAVGTRWCVDFHAPKPKPKCHTNITFLAKLEQPFFRGEFFNWQLSHHSRRRRCRRRPGRRRRALGKAAEKVHTGAVGSPRWYYRCCCCSRHMHGGLDFQHIPPLQEVRMGKLSSAMLSLSAAERGARLLC